MFNKIMVIDSLVSIVMPVRDASLYLRDCLDSILQQSYLHWELTAVNDNSVDDTLCILEEYANIDSRITVLNIDGGRQGIIPALQLAYRNCNGGFITRMDADDIMSPDKLSKMSSRLQLKGIGHVAIGRVSYFSAGGVGEGYIRYANWLNTLTENESNFTEIYKECVVPSPCWMMRREDFEMIGGFEHDTYPEDYDLCFRMRKHRLQITGINEILHYWRDHETRASRNDPNYKDNRFLSLKLSYFMDEDLNSDATLILWGAGKKGKEIAKLLNEGALQFKWVTNNPNKIGHEIYGQVLESDQDIFKYENPQVIISIAQPMPRKEVMARLKNMEMILGHDYFAFC